MTSYNWAKDSTSKANKPRHRLLVPETHTWAINIFFQTALWFSALLWGASASFFSTDIVNFHFPTTWSDLQYPINWFSVNYFASGLVLAFIFATGAWVSRAQNQNVVDRILTMPPHDFWLKFGSTISKTDALVENRSVALMSTVIKLDENKHKPLSEDNKKMIVEAHEAFGLAVRTILDAVITLVKMWDSNNLRGSSIIYRANLMKVYRFGYEDGQLNPESYEFKELNEVAKRFTVQPAISHYSGFVALTDHNFTTTTETLDPLPDRDRKPIAFPFTELTNKLEHPIYSNIAGAPSTVISKSHSYVKDVHEIVSSYEQLSNTKDKTILKELREYYDDKSVAHSILSIPIARHATGNVQYVLNIYRNQKGMLYNGDKVKDFSEIIRPFTGSLSRLFDAEALFLKKLEEKGTSIREVKSDVSKLDVIKTALTQAGFSNTKDNADKMATTNQSSTQNIKKTENSTESA